MCPSASIVATGSLLDDQVTIRPASALPLASEVVDVASDVSAVVMVFFVRATVTAATGTGVTLSVALPLFPSLVAVMLVEPAVTAVTSPDASTVATELLLDDQ